MRLFEVPLLLALALVGHAPPARALDGPAGSPAVKGDNSSGLVLRLTAATRTFKAGAPIAITFRIENTQRGYWTIFPRIRPEGHSPSHSPQSEIAFVIRDRQGRRVPYIGHYDSFSIPPSVNSGLQLVEGAFFGMTVEIDEGAFAYAVSQPGLYSVYAEFRHHARSWVRGWLQADAVGESDLPYELDRVFDGVVTSDPIEIEVKGSN